MLLINKVCSIKNVSFLFAKTLVVKRALDFGKFSLYFLPISDRIDIYRHLWAVQMQRDYIYILSSWETFIRTCMYFFKWLEINSYYLYISLWCLQ